MAGAAADAAIGEVIRAITPFVKRHFQYLCCFNSNIQSLEKEEKDLKDEEVALRRQVSQERRNARVIIPAVGTWLTNTKHWQDEITKIQDPSVRRGCLNIGSRYSRSRQAKKTSVAVQKHRNERPSLDSIAHDAPPACVAPIPQSVTREFQSRKQIEDEILDSLTRAGGNSNFGIGGMGGLGKTTMAESIKHKMKTKKQVDEVVMVVVSQPVDMLRIQLGIGEQLGLVDIKCLETVEARAQKLHQRLTGTKRILIILDDIWEVLHLQELGIPSTKDSGNCIVLLTSRNEDLLNHMNAKVFKMEILREKEAMVLFKDKAGIHEDDQHLMSIAYDVVKECKGLPLALVTLGTALKDALKDKDHRICEDALDGLKGNNPATLKPVLEQVYKPLRVSYDLLKEPEAELLFLLCSLFPEDFNISFEMLTHYGMGLNMFNGVGSVHQARNRVCARVAMLKSRSLLLDSEYADHVRMHDVIRDVAIYIASEKGLDHEWISVFPNLGIVTLDHLVGYNFRKLQLMIIDLDFHIMKTNEFSVLEGKGSLKVLSMKNSLLRTIELPKNLQTLHLNNCALSSISMVGKLSNLEILVCYSCLGIEELPIEVSNLTRLKLLHLTRCRNLKRIVPGVLSKLVKLEELNLSESFTGWESTEVNSGERMNASLKELESLTKLINLNIHISNSNLVGEEIHLRTSPQKYRISFGPQKYRISFGQRNYVARKTDKYVSFKGSTIASWVLKLARRAKGLSLCESGPEIFMHLLERATEVISRLESLEIEACEKIEELLCIAENREDGKRCVIQFQNLKILILKDLPSLKTFGKCIESIEFPMLDCLEIWNAPKLKSLVSIDEHNHDGLSSHCLFNNQIKFDKLRDLRIYKCGNIKSLFSFSIANSLVTLTRLRIHSCEDMESVIMDGNEMHGNFVEIKNESKKDGGTIGYHITFSKLVELELHQLPSLMTFSTSEIERIDFPSLEKLTVDWCPKFKYMITSSKSEVGHNLHDGGDNESLQLFCNKKVKFDKLRYLWIFKCDNIRGLFSFSIANSLVTLTTLCIQNCEDMESVIVDGNEMHGNFVEMKNGSKKDGGTIGYHITFPKLVELKLCLLPSLMTFSPSEIERIDFPSLETLKVECCPKFKYMSTSSKSEDGHNLHDDDDNESLHLFCNKKIKFDRLRDLDITQCAQVNNVWCQHISPCFFKTLESLNIWNFDNIRGLFSFSIVGSLTTLTRLSIGLCKDMERVIADEKEMQENFVEMKNKSKKDGETIGHHITFPKLVELRLDGLPSLMTFSTNEIERIDFPSLEKLEVRNCQKFKYMITSLKSENRLNLHDGGDHESLHLFCNTKVKFDRLKSLKLDGFDDSVSNIFCEQCPLNIFKSLEDLSIWDCCMKSLFSTSIVQELDNLQSLSIFRCQQMEKVIVDEKGKHKNFPLAFPNLKNLKLQYLSSLRCAFDCTLQLPLLEELEIEFCPGMEFLTCNSLSTPKLKSVRVDYTKHNVEDFGLNAFIRQLITSKIEKGSTSYETEDKHEPAGNENEDDDLEVQPTLDDNVALDAAILDGSDALDSTIIILR